MLETVFLSQINLRMLWDVVMENEEIQKNRQAAAKLFNKSTPSFCSENEQAKHCTNLTELNKTFLSFMIQNLTNKSVNTSVTTEKKELITHEQLQEEKQSLFQRDLQSKQKEFENSMARPIPDSPVFSDNIKDEPISEMELMIKKTLEERNFEIQQIHQNQPNATEWLKPEETSVKQEKLQKIKKIIQTNNVEPSSMSEKLLSKLKPARTQKLKENTTTVETATEISLINSRLDKLESILMEIRDSLQIKNVNTTEK